MESSLYKNNFTFFLEIFCIYTLDPFFLINSLLDQFHGRPFYFSPHKFSSLEIPNLIFLPFTFFSFYFLSFCPFSFFSLFFPVAPPILLAWPIFSLRPNRHVARFSPSSSSGVNRIQDETLS
jgi:hypothetical protein